MTPELKAWRAANRDKLRAASKRHYEKHKAELLARNKKWRDENQAYLKNWREQNRERMRAHGRKAEYNLTPEEYEQKKQEQDNKCAICKQEADLLVVDHDHKCCPQRKTCGKCNRGLLCRSCNTAIGLLQESEEIILNAIQYLRRHNG
jgi:hypothetical protein